jgi:hypothetical protein
MEIKNINSLNELGEYFRKFTDVEKALKWIAKYGDIDNCSLLYDDDVRPYIEENAARLIGSHLKGYIDDLIHGLLTCEKNGYLSLALIEGDFILCSERLKAVYAHISDGKKRCKASSDLEYHNCYEDMIDCFNIPDVVDKVKKNLLDIKNELLSDRDKYRTIMANYGVDIDAEGL